MAQYWAQVFPKNGRGTSYDHSKWHNLHIKENWEHYGSGMQECSLTFIRSWVRFQLHQKVLGICIKGNNHWSRFSGTYYTFGFFRHIILWYRRSLYFMHFQTYQLLPAVFPFIFLVYILTKQDLLLCFYGINGRQMLYLC